MPSERQPDLRHEYALRAQGHRFIAGVDEVGRGSLAGPVVAAAVILPLDRPELQSILDGVRDSKKVTAAQRTRLDTVIRETAIAAGIGFVPRSVIDSRGIAAASRLAMHRAIASLAMRPDALLIDAFALKRTIIPQLAFPRADETSLSVAAASILAKVRRDRWMTACGRRFPQYGFERHMGYGTQEHRDALQRNGPCALHRLSFAPVAMCDQS